MDVTLVTVMMMIAKPWCKADARAGSFYFDEVAPLPPMMVMMHPCLHDDDDAQGLHDDNGDARGLHDGEGDGGMILSFQ